MTGFRPPSNTFSIPQFTLQLYNLVEVTVTRCVEAVHDAAADSDRWTPADLFGPTS